MKDVLPIAIVVMIVIGLLLIWRRAGRTGEQQVLALLAWQSAARARRAVSEGWLGHGGHQGALRRARPGRGKLMSDPHWLRETGKGDSVRVEITDLNDWLFEADGEVEGGFTQQVMLEIAEEQHRGDD